MARMIRVAAHALALLVITSGAAGAGPVVSFVGFLTGGFGGAAAASFGVFGSAFGIAALRVVGTLALSAASARLNRPRLPPPQDQMVNLSQPMSFMERVYGRVRKGGRVGFTVFVGTSRFYVVIIAAHRTKGPVQHWLDDFQVTIDSTGFVPEWPIGRTTYTHGYIFPYRGLPGQAVDPTLLAYVPAITTEFDFAQLSYAVVQANRPEPNNFVAVYPNGRQWEYAPVWDGHDAIYDPRTNTYGFTHNAALIIAAEAAFHGKEVDWAEVAAEAAICDETITNGDGGTQRRWTANVIFSDDVPWEAARDTLGMCSDAWFYERPDGKVGFKVGRYITPTITLTDRDFLSIEVSDKAWGPDVAGEFVISYVEPARDYRPAPSGAFVLEAGKPRRQEECWAIDSHNQASRVAKRMGLVARARFTLRGAIKLIGYEVIGQRFLRITHAGLGFDQVVEVDKLVLDAGGLTFSIEAHSTSAADFAFDAATEEPVRPVTEEVSDAPSVAGVTGFSGAVVPGAGGVAQIEWTWPAQAATLTQEVEVQSIDAGITEWQRFAIAPGQTQFAYLAAVDGATYSGRIRNVSGSSAFSAWSDPPISVVAVANTVAPSALTAFAAAVASGDAVISFTAPNSANYSRTRIYRGTTSTFSAAVQVAEEFGAPNAVDSWRDVAPAAGTYYYWAEPTNGSGIAGPRSGPASVTI